MVFLEIMGAKFMIWPRPSYKSAVLVVALSPAKPLCDVAFVFLVHVTPGFRYGLNFSSKDRIYKISFFKPSNAVIESMPTALMLCLPLFNLNTVQYSVAPQ